MPRGGLKKQGYAQLASKDVEMRSLVNENEKKTVISKQLTMYELFRVLLPYFWPAKGSDGALINRVRSTSTWLMVVLSKVGNLAAPYFISQATNYLVGGKMALAVRSMIIYSVLRFLSSLFKELQSILYIKVKQQAGIELQELTFTHLHSLSLNWHLSKKTGSVMKSMDRGVEAANSLVSYLFLYLIPAFAECLAVVILFFVQFRQWQLGLLVFIGVCLYSVSTIVITQWRKKFREQTNKHDNEFHEKATDSIINYETVKYFTNEKYEVMRFTSAVASFQQQVSANMLSLNLLNVVQQLILNITMAGTMIVAGYAVFRGEMTLGGWIAVQSWVSTIFAPLNWLGSVYSAIFQAFIDIRNLSELLAESPDIVDDPDATNLSLIPVQHSDPRLTTKSPLYKPLYSSGGLSVEFRDVTFHYPEQPAEKGLKRVSFIVHPGTTTAIVGHTGSGKTTISRLLFRFYDPIDGAVLINGQNIRHCTQQSVRRAIGIVPQDTVLFNDTIRHNIGYGKLDATTDEIQSVAAAAQIKTFVESLPDAWESMVGERGLKLSGGEKQRVAIARCLLKNPPVVLLDEATSALDTLTENSIQEALHALGQNRTVLVIAHRLSTIRHADQIIVMDHGEIIEKGSHDELLSKKDGQYANMWAMQLSSALNGARLDEASKQTEERKDNDLEQ